MSPSDLLSVSREYSQHGVVQVDRLIPPDQAKQIALALTGNESGAAGKPGLRNLLAHEAVHKLAWSQSLLSIAHACLSAGALPIKATLFDKSDDANWLVAWHQDPAIPVQERVDVAGWSGWTVKGGVHHVHPPVSVLERVLAIRVHLDEVTRDNGPLRVAPGTHRQGRIRSDEAASIAKNSSVMTCVGSCGSAVVMSPLVLHASSKSESASRRRVLHLEYSDAVLPEIMRWPAFASDVAANIRNTSTSPS